MPFFSIIIPVQNALDDLKVCLQKIQQQIFIDYEIIVIDGQSKDDTISYLEEAGHSLNLKYVSEPDTGLYDAMNKGISLSQGKYLYFQGADDTFFSPTVLRSVFESIKKRGYPDFIYGNVVLGDSDYVHNGEYNLSRLYYVNICHQSIFYAQKVFQVIGKYDLMYPVYADWLHNFKCFSNSRLTRSYTNIIVSRFNLQGMSSRRKDALIDDKRALFLRIAKQATKAEYFQLRLTTLNTQGVIHRFQYLIFYSLWVTASLIGKSRTTQSTER